jgi:integral membrane protein
LTTRQEEPATVSPRRLFRSFAVCEMFTWAGLITALILRALDVVNVVPVAGGIHGFVFLCYAATTVFVWVNQKWRFGLGLTGLLLAIVPFATVPFEILVDRRGLLADHWRLAPGGDAPQGFIEQVQAWILRNVLVSIVLLVVLVTTLFTILLWLGPPVPHR